VKKIDKKGGHAYHKSYKFDNKWWIQDFKFYRLITQNWNHRTYILVCGGIRWKQRTRVQRHLKNYFRTDNPMMHGNRFTVVPYDVYHDDISHRLATRSYVFVLFAGTLCDGLYMWIRNRKTHRWIHFIRQRIKFHFFFFFLYKTWVNK